MFEYKTKTMLAAVSISKYEGRKRDKKATEELSVAKHVKNNAARVNKDLFANSAMSSINTAAMNARLIHYKYTLPWSDDGYRILPVELYNEYLRNIIKYKHAFEDAVKDFIVNYEQYINEAKQVLGNLWNELDYPPRNEVARKFSFEVKFMPMPDAKDFRVDIAEQELVLIQEDIKRRTDKAVVEALRDPLLRLHEAIKHLAEKLSDPEGRFHYTTLDNLKELIELLPKFNFVRDPTIDALADELKNLVVYSADTLREDKAVRSEVAQQAHDFINKLEQWM